MKPLRLYLTVAIISGGLGFLLPGQLAASEVELPTVVRIRVDSIIHPVAAEFIVESLAEADGDKAAAFILELSTPGGLLTSTRDIFTAMMGASTPVVVFVAPSGSQAASAGFFLLMAADVAAMAPGTNTGAAHPVGGSGEDIEGDMGETHALASGFGGTMWTVLFMLEKELGWEGGAS